ncbi:hypothetical protein BH23BAC3_BH23BAC3_22350 [soil metagenome]
MIRRNDTFLQDEFGSTLTEMLVALALLMVVIVPTIGLLGLLSGNQLVKRQSTALHYAQYMMEQTLIYESYTDTLYSPAPGWEIRRAVTRHENLIQINVSVLPPESTNPAVELFNARLQPKSK